MKNTVKNNETETGDKTGVSSSKPAAELFPKVEGSKPIDGEWATARQIGTMLPFASIDETFLRNRAREINPRTGSGWIPSPIDRKFQIQPTITGLFEWFYVRAEAKSDLPAQYANMQAMENALGTNKRAIRWLLKNGAGNAQDPANRIAPLPVIRRAFEIIGQVADGRITGIDGLEQWNKDTELAKKLRLEHEALADEQIIRRGEMLISKDATFAITELAADELIWEKRDQPLRALLLAAPKTINRQHRTILSVDGTTPDRIKKCADVVQAAFTGILEKLRTKIPKRQAITAEPAGQPEKGK